MRIGTAGHEGGTSERLLLLFGEHLHRHGVPAHRLERTLTELAQHLCLEAQFFSTPTSLFVGLGRQPDQRVVLQRLEPGVVDLGRIAELDALARAVLSNGISTDSAVLCLQALAKPSRRYEGLARALAFAAASGAAAVVFGGAGPELAAASVLGLFIGLLDRLVLRGYAWARLFVLVAAGVVGAGAAIAESSSLGASFLVVTLAGVLVLLPGYTLTVAMTELSTGHLASGTARLAGAIVVFVQLGFGVALGSRLVRGLSSTGALPLGLSPTEWPVGALIAAVMASPLCFGVLMRARKRDFPAIAMSCGVAFVASRWGSGALGPELGSAVGALATGLFANGWARLFDQPSSVPLVPAILLLVPGSVGLRGVMSMLSEDAVTGVDLAFGTLLIAVGLVAGLLMASALLPPRRAI